MRILCIPIVFIFLLMACGGGGGSGGKPPDIGCQDCTPVIPSPSESRTFQNPNAVDPLASFKNVEFPSLSKFDYELDLPDGDFALDLSVYIAPDANPPSDLVPMMRRAAKVWTRQVTGLRNPVSRHRVSNPPQHYEPGTDGWVRMDFLVGHEDGDRCAREMCANHYSDPLLMPTDRPGRNPIISATPRFSEQECRPAGCVRNGQVTLRGFGVMAHEFGHILDHYDPTNPSYTAHSNCVSDGIMCDSFQDLVPAVPQGRDFGNIEHHYTITEPADHEVFGIWANIRNVDSDLNNFGIQLTRTLIVNQATNIQSNIWGRPASDFITDTIRIETMIDGTASTNITSPINTGTATWNGDLIAVDTARFQPVLGDATLSMDLTNTDFLQASFTDVYRSDDTGMTHAITDFGYRLAKSGTSYVDVGGSINARFYAIGTDNTAAVAGILDDRMLNLMGAYGAIRNDIRVPPPEPMAP